MLQFFSYTISTFIAVPIVVRITKGLVTNYGEGGGLQNGRGGGAREVLPL